MAEYEKPCSTKSTVDFKDRFSECNNRAIKSSIDTPSFRRTRLIVAGTCNTLDVLDEGCRRGKLFTDVESNKFFNKTYNI